LGIQRIEFKVQVHGGRDGGARKSGPEMLALEKHQYSHALLILDFEGSGTDEPDALLGRSLVCDCKKERMLR
jgi:hypothetical protein